MRKSQEWMVWVSYLSVSSRAYYNVAALANRIDNFEAVKLFI